MPSSTLLSAQQAAASTHQSADVLPGVLSDWRLWQLLEQPPQPNQLRPLCGGLTNQSWLLSVNEQRWVIRINAANSGDLDIRRDHEYFIQQRAAEAGLAPRVLYRCPDDVYWIVEYLDGPSLRDVLKQGHQPWPQLQQRLHSLHDLPLTSEWHFGLEVMDVCAKAEVYWQAIEQRLEGRWNSDWQQLKQQLQAGMAELPGPERSLCHMDPNPDNWKWSNNQWRLIDWEYATVGHPLWDIASLVQMSEGNPAEQAMLLVDLGIDPEQPDWQQANRQLACLNSLWYGAQGIWNARELRTALQSLV